MHLLNWASPTPGASEVGLPHVTRALGFICGAACIEAARTAFPLFGRRLHFDDSFAACIEVPHRAPAFACIFTFHLQRASKEVLWSTCGQMHPVFKLDRYQSGIDHSLIDLGSGMVNWY